MCCNREGYEEWFERKGLVEWACEKKVILCGGNRASQEWYYRGIRDVKGGENSENIGGVSLEANHWELLDRLQML